ncbi:MAG: hypothetical protein A2W93_14330 [Bacteroidetes bacterium GWF2_43_63]|nr:MAG: hypothetical protein A2W94_00900 [Bacteroidetes bacterium GWE2_42_42]OFY52518.1 MAG: hypothetical protein A2W93_14330 [Bacteroidetes bacterium GWF2_43_63]HBG71425.1 hypothetical protein [Bacteroidales bacterium]HCB60823.1 hypothetical protein [Bacteroidales bacterium]HCY23452.1 hypothetical protein [Bacteroidales bacterium]
MQRESTKKLHAIVIQVYQDVIAGHGKYASMMPKAMLYTEVAEDPRVPFNEITVAQIIREHLKHGVTQA